MQLLPLLLLALLIYPNVRLAKSKGKNPIVWGIVTFIAFLASYTVFGGIYISMVYKGPREQNALFSYLNHEPLALVMLCMLGIGGVLLVRFILERAKGSDVA